jgi:hypothetical protein
MKVIDSFLPKAYEDFLEGMFLSVNFPWYLNLTTVDHDAFNAPNTIGSPQFTHTFVRDGVRTSEHYPSIAVLLYHLMLTENIRTDNPKRIKANLNNISPLSDKESHYPVHVDFNSLKKGEMITCIYYVNDCDGDTIMFDQTGKKEISRVSPKKGRLVYFDTLTPHAGQPPKNSYARCVLNINIPMGASK